MRDKAWRLSPEHLGRLIALLAEQGYEVIGPRKEGAAIRWGPVGSLDDLPAGVGSESTPGHYRLRARGSGALCVGPVAGQRQALAARAGGAVRAGVKN
jgi:hypothetical protein